MHINHVKFWKYKQRNRVMVTANRSVMNWFVKFHFADRTLKNEPSTGCLFDFNDDFLKTILEQKPCR